MVGEVVTHLDDRVLASIVLGEQHASQEALPVSQEGLVLTSMLGRTHDARCLRSGEAGVLQPTPCHGSARLVLPQLEQRPHASLVLVGFEAPDRRYLLDVAHRHGPPGQRERRRADGSAHLARLVHYEQVDAREHVTAPKPARPHAEFARHAEHRHAEQRSQVRERGEKTLLGDVRPRVLGLDPLAIHAYGPGFFQPSPLELMDGEPELEGPHLRVQSLVEHIDRRAFAWFQRTSAQHDDEAVQAGQCRPNALGVFRRDRLHETPPEPVNANEQVMRRHIMEARRD